MDATGLFPAPSTHRVKPLPANERGSICVDMHLIVYLGCLNFLSTLFVLVQVFIGGCVLLTLTTRHT